MHTHTHTHTNTHIPAGPHQFSRPPHWDLNRIVSTWLSWFAPFPLQPRMSSVGICLFRRSYITPGSDLYGRLIHGKALLMITATSNVTLLSMTQREFISTMGKFTSSYDILIGCGWQWDDGDFCFVHPHLAKYWFCLQIPAKMENYNVLPRAPSILWQHSVVIMYLDPASDNVERRDKS